MLIVDAHLDLAYNATRGRDPRMPAASQPPADGEIATVGLPDLHAGNVGLICATIFCAPAGYGNRPGYTNAEEARRLAMVQLDWYRRCIDEGLVQFVRSAAALPNQATKPPLPAILLLEGADPIRSPDDLPQWFDAGLRIVGMAWKQTRYAGGTGAPGPLTAEGRRLVRALDQIGIIHDASHLAEQSFWDLMDLTDRPVIATHSNCRAIVEGDRQLSDQMIRAIAGRGGVIGVNFYHKFLLPRAEHGKRRATLADVTAHVKHICDLTGSAAHVGIGSDMDGGLGREQIPVEIQTSADLPRVPEALSAEDFSDADVLAIMGGNWLRLFARLLPRSAETPSPTASRMP